MVAGFDLDFLVGCSAGSTFISGDGRGLDNCEDSINFLVPKSLSNVLSRSSWALLYEMISLDGSNTFGSIIVPCIRKLLRFCTNRSDFCS
jgi:hypothetical protein